MERSAAVLHAKKPDSPGFPNAFVVDASLCVQRAFCFCSAALSSWTVTTEKEGRRSLRDALVGQAWLHQGPGSRGRGAGLKEDARFSRQVCGLLVQSAGQLC